MPFRNYHAIRVGHPGSYKRIRPKKWGPGIMAYGGPLNKPPKKKVGTGRATGWKVQSVRFHRDKFTLAQAKKWMIGHGHPRSSWKLVEKATGKDNPGTHGKKKKSMSEQVFRSLLNERLKAL